MTGPVNVPIRLVGGPFNGETVDAALHLVTPALELDVAGDEETYYQDSAL